MSANAAAAFSDAGYIPVAQERRQSSGPEAFARKYLVARADRSGGMPAWDEDAHGQFLQRSLQSAWLENLHRKLRALRDLPMGWDGHDGSPLSYGVAVFSAELLKGIYCDGAPDPSLVPGSDGSLQIEWHCCGYDVEIAVYEPYEVECSRSAVDSGPDQEESFWLANFEDLRPWVQDLVDGRERRRRTDTVVPCSAASALRNRPVAGRQGGQGHAVGMEGPWGWTTDAEEPEE